MTSFIMKFIMCPVIVIISDWLFPGIEFNHIMQPIIVGIVIAIVGTAMEYMLLTKRTVWLSTIADFAAAFLIVYFVSNWMEGGAAAVTFLGALLTALLIGISEHMTHRWLVRNNKVRKSV